MSELPDVKDKLNVMVRELSLGERMKMELIGALLHQPKVLFLDEPIIDHGTIFFDGLLEEVTDRFADYKLITIDSDREQDTSKESFSKHGEVLECAPTRLKLKVKRERVVPVCKELFDIVSIKDTYIKEAPIEDIIRKLFDRKQNGTPAS
ncbi:MAG: hypothetical protein CMO80_02225 [Verrucomicrobiales bacterium]|nr:hypothetical protein [Verrucomicrobiales bacterium]|tara:strand:+ start:418 stop:867 length:450 start_codon:yes stop_codon:yes gene_type:complete